MPALISFDCIIFPVLISDCILDTMAKYFAETTQKKEDWICDFRDGCPSQGGISEGDKTSIS